MLNYAHGAIQWLAADAVSTTYPQVCTDVETGLTFQPTALRFSWCGAQSASDLNSTALNINRGVGFAKDTSNRRCVASFSADNAAAADCATIARNDSIACTTDGAAASDGMLDLSSVNSDGFTAIVDNQPTASQTVFWEAWGGDEAPSANVTVGDIAEPAGTGNVDYTATGFVPGAEDQVVMLAGVQSTAALNTGLAESSSFFIGYATGPGREQCVMFGQSDDGSLVMDTDGTWLSGECITMMIAAGAATMNARASLTQFNAGGFRLNWAERTTTSRRSIYMAIKGGGWLCGDFKINYQTVNNTAKVSGLRFKPKGVSFITSVRTERAADSSTSTDQMVWGCASSPSSRRCMSTCDTDGADPSAIAIVIEYDQIGVDANTTGILSATDFSAWDVDGFTVIIDTANASGSLQGWTGFLVFGSALNYIGALRERAKDQPMIRGPM